MRSMTKVSLVEMYNMAPTPTVAVTSARRPSESSRVSESPTMEASEPNREMISPVERTPDSLTIAVAEVTASGSTEVLLDFVESALTVEGVSTFEGEGSVDRGAMSVASEVDCCLTLVP